MIQMARLLKGLFDILIVSLLAPPWVHNEWQKRLAQGSEPSATSMVEYPPKSKGTCIHTVTLWVQSMATKEQAPKRADVGTRQYRGATSGMHTK